MSDRGHAGPPVPAGQHAPPAEAACVHEYTLNVQLTHAWCQKCDLVIPITDGDQVRRFIAAQAAAAEREACAQLIESAGPDELRQFGNHAAYYAALIRARQP